MLEIKNISKTYKTGDLVQKALDNVSLNLRDNEFVAILGPSGSGKTTLLNIIGGLDKYDSGDLIINGISTKNYKDKNWDAYRNHTIGFVFQSYNLIPHQTILGNVELALTIAGVSSSKRKKMALDALEKVGLKEQAHKKPNQLSGGQMQRVAIARALVNNPSIVLADEPTGALDTKTSIQVMDLLKEVAKDRLVVMVTHNPELANEYASRIVNLKDGHIIDDSNPYNPTIIEENEDKKIGKAHMGFFTALSLSFNNLLSKKGRTILTAFAGSIGIIGIALILALSTGFQNYIDSIQEETMSSYPLQIQSETTNVFSAMLSYRMGGDDNNSTDGKIKEQMMISSMFNSIGSNDIKSFLTYLNNNEDLYKDDVKKITYSYSVSPRIYTKDVTDSIIQLNPNTLMSSIYSDSASSLLSSMSSSSSMGTFAEYDTDTLKENCELLTGIWPTSYDEVIIVLSDKDKISDLLVYSLGLRDNSELKTLINEVMAGEEASINNEPKEFTYDDLMNVELKLVNVADLYKYNDKYDTYEDMSDDNEYMEDVYDNATTLKIVGIAYSTGESSSIAGVIYSPDLTQHVIDEASKTEIVKKQLANKDIDVFSGKGFDEDSDESGINFNDMVSVDEDKLKNAFSFNLDTSALEDTDRYTSIVTDNSESIKENILKLTDTYSSLIKTADTNIAKEAINQYVNTLKQSAYSVYTINACEGGMEYKDETTGLIASCIFSDDAVEGTDYGYIPDGTNMRKYSIKSGYSETKYVPFPKTDNNGNSMADTLINGLDPAYQSVVDAFKNSEAALDISKDNVKKVVGDVVYNYFNLVSALDSYTEVNTPVPGTDTVITTYIVKEDELNTVTVDSVTDTLFNYDEIASMIYGEAYENATKMMSNVAALGVLNAVTDTMSPVQEMFSDSENMVSVDTSAFSSAFNFELDEDELTRLMSSRLTSSTASYSNNLTALGYQETDEPTSISIYFNDFDAKDNFLNLIADYNKSVDEEQEISYTDITGMLMSSVQTIINAVTYVLIAFVSISLIVSSIMIAVITLISVMERTKEIGILRAMGASKKNVSSIFNAETFIIGLLSGLLGVTVSYLLTIPINNIIHKLTDINEINAVLNLKPAIVLVLISVFLTMIAGFIPSKKASKQDPVIALRSE